jgi:mitogen-activated protein kinase kinase kinase 13
VISSQSTLSVVSSSSAGDVPPTPLTPPRTRGRKLSERHEKHVGFVESAQEAVEQDDQSASEGEDEGSDDGSASLDSHLPEPSPRRLRSRWTARSTSSVGSMSTNSGIQPPRKLPPRQAKDKGRSFNEDDTELDDKDSGGDELPASSELGEEDDDASSGSGGDSTPESRPIRQRKDSKASKSRLQTPPPEDNDMESPYESDKETVDGYQPTPRKLRNGKVLQKDQALPPPAPAADDDSSELSELSEMDTSVTEESSDSEVDDKNDEDYVEEDSAVTMATVATAGVDDERSTTDTDDDVDAEGEDEEIDLEEQTVTTLARYRKEQLVRLCESKGLDAEGTKPQLVKALLQWVSICYNFKSSCVLSLLVAVTSSICFLRGLNCPRSFNSCTPSSSSPTQTTGTTRRQAGP